MAGDRRRWDTGEAHVGDGELFERLIVQKTSHNCQVYNCILVSLILRGRKCTSQ